MNQQKLEFYIYLTNSPNLEILLIQFVNKIN